MTLKRWMTAGVAAAAIGCGGSENKAELIPAMKNASGAPADTAAFGGADGQSKGGENPYGPKRADADKKIEEIKKNSALADDLKKQLIDEVERTYKAAQDAVKKS